MTYQEAIDFLLNLELFGIKLGLENITGFLERLDQPQKSLRAVHIAGTNGKGSVASIFESVFFEAGLKVGKFTSPHLYDFRERFHVGKKKIDENFVTGFVGKHRKYIADTRTTFFETCTAMAFEWFRHEKVDMAVVEVGLGGRLDATSLIEPDLTVIAKIARDHTKILGDTIAKIALEKCGIIKSGIPLVTSACDPEALEVIRKVSSEKNAPLFCFNPESMVKLTGMDSNRMNFTFSPNSLPPREYSGNLVGIHQLENYGLVLLGLKVMAENGLQISPDSIGRGLGNVYWPARMQYIPGKPSMILDCAHNPDGFRALSKNLACIYPNRKFVTLLGMLNRPDYPEIFEEVSKFADPVILTVPVHNDRTAVPEALAREAVDFRLKFKLIPNIPDAYNYAKELTAPDDILLAVGSHFTLGEIMKSENIPT